MQVTTWDGHDFKRIEKDEADRLQAAGRVQISDKLQAFQLWTPGQFDEYRAFLAATSVKPAKGSYKTTAMKA